jgi:putative ABC transport system substrate-binding protein
MRRRAFLYGAVAMLGAPPAVQAQQAKKVPRLCFLIFDPGTFETRSPRWESFFQRLGELGYVHGRTIVIDYLSAGGRHERFPELAEECLRRKADVIAVTTTPGGHAAKKATQTTPIVMLSLGRPGRHRACRQHRPSRGQPDRGHHDDLGSCR